MERNFKVIEINQDGKFIKNDSKYFYIGCGKNIRFVYLGNFKIGHQMFLITNLNNINNKKTQVENIQELQNLNFEQFQNSYNLLKGTFEEQLFWSTEVNFQQPGTFSFQLVIVKNQLHDKQEGQIMSHQSLDETDFYKRTNLYNVSQEINRILIYMPYINDQTNVQHRRHDFINMLTLFPVMLGSFEKWESKLQNFIERGYKGFHFTPIQNIGPSNSAYCIQDFSKFNQKIFQKNENYIKKLKDLFNKLKQKYDCFFMIDILFNHCSVDCYQILDNQDATFNTINTPQLNIAYILDKELQKYNQKLIDLNTYIQSEEDIQKILKNIQDEVIEKINIEDYFTIDIDKVIKELITYFENTKDKDFLENLQKNSHGINFVTKNNFKAIEDCFYNYGAGINSIKVDIKIFSEQIEKTFYYLNTLEIKKLLEEINKKYKLKVNQWKQDIIQSIEGSLRYQFLQLKNYKVSETNKIANEYFLEYKNLKIAKNGWIMNYSNDQDFVLHEDQFYLRRQIVIWEDLVKIRYINQNKDSFIWQYMNNYVIQMAQIFDGFRFDNFHNSDLNSAKYFIKSAFKHNKYLFNISELFLPDQKKVIELCEQASVHRMVQEVKAFENPDELDRTLEQNSRRFLNYFNLADQTNKKYLTPLYKAIYPKKIFYDQTHDNPTLYQNNKIRIQLPLLAVLSYIGEMTGTTFGYDEMLINQIHVTCQEEYPSIQNNIINVSKKDNYVLFNIDKDDFEYEINENIYKVELKGSFDNWQQGYQIRYNEKDSYWDWINLKPNEYQFKFLINEKFWMINKNFETIQDDKGNLNNIIQVLRNDMNMHENYIDFRKYFNNVHDKQKLNFKVQIKRIKDNDDVFLIRRYRQDYSMCQKLIVRYNTQKVGSKNFDIPIQGKISSFEKIGFADENYDIVDQNTKFPRIKARIYETQNIQHFAFIKITDNKMNTLLSFKNIPDNFICVINCQEDEQSKNIIKYLRKEFDSEEGFINKAQININLEDINYFLYSCENEEQDKYQRGTFYIPNYGQLVFAGFSGLKNILVQTAIDINKNHPVFNMIIENDYLIDYYKLRVQTYHDIKFNFFKQKFCEICEKIKQLPRFLIPTYFQKLIFVVIEFFEEKFLSMIQIRDVLKKNYFFQNLILSIPQFLTKKKNNLYLVSAGLPHFSTGMWKNWGRDTFISFKGIFIVPKLFEQGKQILLHYAKYIRHGLIPNLLSPSRYNARDATWWFIKAVRDYLEATNDYKILNEKVIMEYLSDDQQIDKDLKQKNHQTKIQFIELLQMIFQKHASGIRFKEWNAPHIDEHMLEIDWNCGFIFGGNSSNCLTWMDKMGSSTQANNKGIPGSSRYGAPIELTSLLYIGVRLMNMLYGEGFSQHKGVQISQNKSISYKEWKHLISQNFQKYYWIPDKVNEYENYIIEDVFVKRKGILKDCYSNNKHDYMLRPNALIAIAIAPKLIDHDKSVKYLNQVTKNLLKKQSIGVKTLDPQESIYYADYNNNDESDNFYTGRGYNYHNGPEWVWLYGFYLMAVNRLEERCPDIALKQINRIRNHLKVVQQSDWLSLPELTNDNGKFCKDSCQSQLWSVACMLQAFNCVYEQLKILQQSIQLYQIKGFQFQILEIMFLLVKSIMKKISEQNTVLNQFNNETNLCLCKDNYNQQINQSSSSDLQQEDKRIIFICKKCYQVLCQYCLKQHEKHINSIEILDQIIQSYQNNQYGLLQQNMKNFEQELDNVYNQLKNTFLNEMNNLKQKVLKIDNKQLAYYNLIQQMKDTNNYSQNQIIEYIKIKDEIQMDIQNNLVIEQSSIKDNIENLLEQEIQIDNINNQKSKKFSKYLYWFGWTKNMLNIFDIEIFSIRKFISAQDFYIPQFSRSIMSDQGQLFLIGGECKNGGAFNTVYSVDLQQILNQGQNNKFELIPKSKMNYKKFDFCLSLLNNFIYIFCGKDQNENIVNTSERYDIKNDKWKILKSSNNQRYAASACKMEKQNKIYLFGGRSVKDGSMVEVVDCYNVIYDTWQSLKLIQSDWKPVELCSAISISSDEILIFGGSNNEIQDSSKVYIFNIEQNTLKKQKSMPRPLVFISKPIMYKNQLYTIGNEFFIKSKKIAIYQLKNKKWKICENLIYQLTQRKDQDTKFNQIEQCKKFIAKIVKKTLMIKLIFQEQSLIVVIHFVKSVYSNL